MLVISVLLQNKEFIMHKRSMKALAGHRVEIPINQVVTCDGTSMWMDTNGLKVNVRDMEGIWK